VRLRKGSKSFCDDTRCGGGVKDAASLQTWRISDKKTTRKGENQRGGSKKELNKKKNQGVPVKNDGLHQ